MEDLLSKGRVDFIFPADYSEGTDLDATVKLVVRFARDLGGDACFVPGMAGASPLAREEAADDAELAAQAAADAPAHESAAQRRFDETGAE